MNTIDIDQIVIEDRIRECREDDVETLAKDIYEKGLLQPIVLENPKSKRLVAGAHRLEAIALIGEWAEELGLEGTYKFNGEKLSCEQAPYVYVGDLTPAQMIEYEIAENLVRVQMTWQDRSRAITKIHEALGEGVYSKTAAALTSAGDNRSSTALITEVSKAAIISSQLDDPDVAKAKTMSEAWTVVNNKANRLHAEVLGQMEDAEERLDSPHTLHHADMTTWMKEYEGEPFDLIIADPPYGSGADEWKSKFIDTPHNYKDDLQTATAIYRHLFREGFKIAADQANLFAFCDPKLWSHWQKMAEANGWATWSRPIIWKKSNEGIRPWGTRGFAYTYETILFCTKGQKGLLKSVNDVIDIYKITSNRLHGAQKPDALYSLLMDISSLPGQRVLDPTCGSGTIFPAASRSRLIATGVEVSEEYYAIAEKRRQESISYTAPQEEETLDDILGDLE